MALPKAERHVQAQCLLVQSTSALDEENNGFPHLASIGFMNKYNFVAISFMALHRDAEKDVINYLARQLESYFITSSWAGTIAA